MRKIEYVSLRTIADCFGIVVMKPVLGSQRFTKKSGLENAAVLFYGAALFG